MHKLLQRLATQLQPQWEHKVDDFIETTVKKEFGLNDSLPAVKDETKKSQNNARVKNKDENAPQTQIVHLERLIDSCDQGRDKRSKCDFLLYKTNDLNTLILIELSACEQKYAEGKPYGTGSKYTTAIYQQLPHSIELLAKADSNFDGRQQRCAIYAYRIKNDAPSNNPMARTQKSWKGAIPDSRTLNLPGHHRFQFRVLRYPAPIIL